MKKLIILLCTYALLMSCTNPDEKTHSITHFNQIIIDTISPRKDIVYTTQLIKVKGFVNDSIYVSFGDKNRGYYLSKEIDTLFNPDYYGGHNAIFIFNPYKAKSGKLKIVFSIL